MKDKRIIEILAEEIISQESTYTDIDDVKNDLLNDVQFELYPATVTTAMQRAVEEQTATIRAEVERLKGFAVHMSNCAWRYNGNGVCTCGLDSPPANG